jgi:biopolymer transport protein ExbD
MEIHFNGFLIKKHMNNFNEPVSKRGRKRRLQKTVTHSTKVDMTPMTDLGFLLIAFFIMTTQLRKPTTMDLNMPADNKEVVSKLGESNALTVLLANQGKLFYYEGNWESALKKNAVRSTTLSPVDGLRKIIIVKQAALQEAKLSKEGRDGLMLLLKATHETDYQTLIDVFDETIITGIKRHALVRPSPEEIKYLQLHP